MYTLANALEPLRLANQVAGRTLCQWQMLSLHGGQLHASNGIATATVQLDQAQVLDVLILCGGDSLHACQRLREQARSHTDLASCLDPAANTAPCGSGLARDEALSADINVEC